MNIFHAALARKHLEQRLAPLRAMTLDPPSRGWMRAIREALGMTARQLAARMGVSVSRIPVIEKAEVTGSTTLRTLRQAAVAMNCTFVYAFVPNEPLDDILHERVMQKVQYDLARLDHTMRLENQALRRADLEAERDRLVQGGLARSLRGLWEDEGRHA